MGTGAYSSLAAATAVAAGLPPLNGNAAVRSYMVTLAQHFSLTTEVGPWLYANPADGALWVYQNTGANIWLTALLMFSAKTGLRP